MSHHFFIKCCTYIVNLKGIAERKTMHNQTLITVRDVEKSAEWYVRNLGLQQGHGGPYYEQLIHEGKLVLQLHCMDADEMHGALLAEGEVPGHGVLLWFSVEDFEEAVARFRENGTVLDREPFYNTLGKQWEVWLSDPDGYKIVISGPSEYPVRVLGEKIFG